MKKLFLSTLLAFIMIATPLVAKAEFILRTNASHLFLTVLDVGANGKGRNISSQSYNYGGIGFGLYGGTKGQGFRGGIDIDYLGGTGTEDNTNGSTRSLVGSYHLVSFVPTLELGGAISKNGNHRLYWVVGVPLNIWLPSKTSYYQGQDLLSVPGFMITGRTGLRYEGQVSDQVAVTLQTTPEVGAILSPRSPKGNAETVIVYGHRTALGIDISF